MKKALLLGLATLIMSSLSAQQEAHFTQNYFNRLFPNPAVAGSNDAICATMFGRQQWVGFDGRPQSYMLSTHMPFTDPWLGEKHGVGLNVVSDQLGQESTISVKASYAYRRQIGPGMLSGGFAIGILNKSIGNEWNSVDPSMDDQAIPDNGASDMVFDMDFGLFYKTKDLYAGISMTHLPATTLSEQTENAIGNPANLNYQMARHYFLIAGYETEIINPDWKIKPNIFVRSDGTSTSFDLGAIMEYRETFWGGINYRLQDAVGPMIGYNYDLPGKGFGGGMLRAGYSYDVTTSNLRAHSSGSHEIMVNYCFNIDRAPKFQRHRTVRFL